MNSPATRIIILGSTGSIGCNTLEVIRHLHACTDRRFRIVGLATGSNAAMVSQQAAEFDVPNIAVANSDNISDIDRRPNTTIFAGEDAAAEMIAAIARPGDLVIGAMVGSCGLPAIIGAIERGCNIGLANKETLVAAGAIVMPLVSQFGIKLLPIDSEHSAIFQCLLAGRSFDEVERVVLTASGGPFRDRTRAEIADATVAEALNHPTWNMGAKVTIDSATLMNKGLEMIEAHWLFNLPASKIAAVIHPQSIVHSFVEFIDGSVFAQLSPPDMKSPIQYVLTWPDRLPGSSDKLHWQRLADLKFQPMDHERFPAVRLALKAIERGGTAGTIFNAANEVAVEAFLNCEIKFGQVVEIVEATLDEMETQPVVSLRDIELADLEARQRAGGMLLQSNP